MDQDKTGSQNTQAEAAKPEEAKPLKPEVPKQEQPVSVPPPDETAAKVAVKANILLIEDDPPMVKMYSTKLEKEGYGVEVAFDGEEGLNKIKKNLPNLVVLDLMIPKIGGMEVLEIIRSEARTKNLPVVILSNLSQEQDIKRAKELGAKAFLIKANFTPGQVVEKIKQALE